MRRMGKRAGVSRGRGGGRLRDGMRVGLSRVSWAGRREAGEAGRSWGLFRAPRGLWRKVCRRVAARCVSWVGLGCGAGLAAGCARASGEVSERQGKEAGG